MKISNLTFAICILAFGANVVSVQAEDNEAQAAARAALEAKFQSLSTPPATKVRSAAQTQADIAMAAEAEASKAEQEAARLAAEAQAKMQAAEQAEAVAKTQAEVAAQAREKAI